MNQHPRFELIPIKQYAALRSVSPRTVRRWIRLRYVQAERTAGPHGNWLVLVPRATAEMSASGRI